MKLPMQPLIERRYAHFATSRPIGVLSLASPCKSVDVMVAHGRARGACLIRYPSPAGRGGCPQGHRPCFFNATVGFGKRQGNSTKRRIMPISSGMTAAQTAARKAIRGKELCKRSQNGALPFSLLGFSADAATPLPNKLCSAVVQGRQLRMSPKATCSRERLSAQWRTSPIARHIRHAAKALTQTTPRLAYAGALYTKATSKHACSEVAFSLPMTTGGQPANATTKGTGYV